MDASNVELVKIVGAAIAFVLALHQWRIGQDWKRAERLDAFIREFETDAMLRLGARGLDYRRKRVCLGDVIVLFDSACVLDALRTDDGSPDLVFEGPSAQMREAFDAFVTFFQRLSTALRSDLIPPKATSEYFGYWVKKMSNMDQHLDPEQGGRKDAPYVMAKFVSTYGSSELLGRLRTDLLP